MAMTVCKECNNEVSTQAEACPKCGAKVKKPSLAVKIIGGVLLFLVLIAVFAPEPSGTATADSDAAEPSSAATDEFSTTANDIAHAYDQNTVAADAQYKGKRFLVTGTITDINTDIMDNAVLYLSGGVNEFMNPHFQISDADKPKTASLSKGENITLSCLGNGDIAKSPMMKDCVIK